MRILGIDPSPTCTAWVILDTDTERLVGHGRIRVVKRDLGDAQASMDDRLKQVEAKLVDLIPHGCNVGLVAYEKQVSMMNFGDAPLHIIAFMIRRRCIMVERLYLEVMHSTAYKAAVGRGNAKKPEVRKALSERFGEHLTEDEADAAAVAIAAQTKLEEMAEPDGVVEEIVPKPKRRRLSA